MARFEARAEADLASFTGNSQHRRMRSPSMIQKQGFSPMFRALERPRDSHDIFNPTRQERNDSPLSVNEKMDTSSAPRTPRLDLDFPKPEFDRYSVMFEKLLEEPKPSLLERRKSKLKQNKSVKMLEPISSLSEKEEANGVPQRSATSPGLRKPLSIRIGKKVHSPANSPEEVTTALHRPRPIQRSKTAPPGAVSPRAQRVLEPQDFGDWSLSGF